MDWNIFKGTSSQPTGSENKEGQPGMTPQGSPEQVPGASTPPIVQPAEVGLTSTPTPGVETNPLTTQSVPTETTPPAQSTTSLGGMTGTGTSLSMGSMPGAAIPTPEKSTDMGMGSMMGNDTKPAETTPETSIGLNTPSSTPVAETGSNSMMNSSTLSAPETGVSSGMGSMNEDLNKTASIEGLSSPSIETTHAEKKLTSNEFLSKLAQLFTIDEDFKKQIAEKLDNEPDKLDRITPPADLDSITNLASGSTPEPSNGTRQRDVFGTSNPLTKFQEGKPTDSTDSTPFGGGFGNGSPSGGAPAA